jgi:hypothetical protein
MADPQIVYGPSNEHDFIYIPVADATDLGKQGDLVSYESNAAVLLDAAAEDATFAGFAITVHVADENLPNDLTVGLRGVLVYDVASATFAIAAGLKYAGSRNKVVADGGYNTIAWSHKREASAVTRLRTLVDVIALGKLFAVSA